MTILLSSLKAWVQILLAHKVLAGVCLLLAVLGLIALSFWGDQLAEFFGFFADPESIKSFISGYGADPVVVYVALQALQVVIAPLPGEISGSVAGLLFGGAYGGFYATVGLALGASVAFGMGRFFGRPLLNLVASKQQLSLFSNINPKKRDLVVLVVFLVPGFPKDVLTYLFSVSSIGFVRFFLLSQLGRLPGTLMLTFGAQAMIAKNWPLVVGIGAVGVFAVGYAVRRRRQIYLWITT